MMSKTIRDYILSDRGKRYIISCLMDYGINVEHKEIEKMINIIPEKFLKTSFFGNYGKNYYDFELWTIEKNKEFALRINTKIDRKNINLINMEVDIAMRKNFSGELEVKRRELAFLWSVIEFFRHI